MKLSHKGTNSLELTDDELDILLKIVDNYEDSVNNLNLLEAGSSLDFKEEMNFCKEFKSQKERGQ